jgi:hypothetical protein
MDKSNKTTVAIVVIVVAIAAFFGGMKYAQSQTTSASANQSGLAGLGGQGRTRGGNFGGANATSGQILSMDDKSITVQIRAGGSKIIFYSPSSKITKSVDGTASDLKVGANIMANGTANSDGSLTAQTIQLRPDVPNAPVGGAGASAANPVTPKN